MSKKDTEIYRQELIKMGVIYIDYKFEEIYSY